MLKSRQILAAAVALLAVRIAHADVLEHVPADALMAIKVANVQQTSTKIAKLAKDFGIDAFVAPIQNPLGWAKTSAKVEKGINDAGEAAFVMFSPKRGDGREPGMIVLVPVSNYAEFISNFAGATTEGNTTVARIAGGRRNSYVSDWGGYAAISPIKALVEAKPTATLKLAGLPAKEAAKQDFLLYANFASITPEVQPELEKAFTEGLVEIDREDEIPAKWKPLLRVGFTQLINIARAGLRDGEAATIGVNISDAGINATVEAQFKPDSYIGKFATGLKNTDKALTTGLPATKYLYYGGMATDPTSVATVFDDITKPIVEELNKIQGQEKSREFAAALSATVRSTRGAVFGMPVPAKIQQDALFQQVTIYDGDAAQYQKLMSATSDMTTSLLGAIEMPQGRTAPKLNTSSPAKTVEGVTLTSWKLDMQTNQDDPNAMQAEAMMGMFYGTEGINYSFGPLGAQSFLLASCASEETIG
ncbi:MAG: hypothetical protein H7144_05495, partial [Burkholderiales bacterium]|nr:hypothetical protein [Phycisphaerae bacterium]